MVKTLTQLKTIFGDWGQSIKENIHLIDTLTTIKNKGVLTDGSAISLDVEKFVQGKAYLETEESEVTITISNFGEVFNLVVKPISSALTTDITLTGTGYQFVDMDSISSSPLDSVVLTCANLYNEISISDCGDLDGTDKVLLVVKK